MPGAIKLASNEVPYGPLPGVRRGHRRGRGRRRTATRTWPRSRCASASPSCSASAPDRVATGCGSVGSGRTSGHGVLPRRGRDPVLLALVRGVPDHRGDRRRGGVRVPNTAEHGHDLAAMAAAVTDRTRLIMRVQSQQPDRYVPARGGTDRLPRRGARRTCWWSSTRRTGSSSPTRPCRTALARYGDRPERGRAADDVQGLGTGRPAGRLPRRPAGGGGRGPQGDHAVLHLGRSPRRPLSPR